MMIREWLEASSAADDEEEDGRDPHPQAEEEAATPRRASTSTSISAGRLLGSTSTRKGGFGSNSRSLRIVSSARMSLLGLPKAPDRELKKKRLELLQKSRAARVCLNGSTTAPSSAAAGRRQRRSLFHLASNVARSSGLSGGSSSARPFADPGSPEVTCVGRIKKKHKELRNRRQISLPRERPHPHQYHQDDHEEAAKTKKKKKKKESSSSSSNSAMAWLKRIFCRAKPASAGGSFRSRNRISGNVHDTATAADEAPAVPARSSTSAIPSLAQLRGVSSSRRESESLARLFPADIPQSERTDRDDRHERQASDRDERVADKDKDTGKARANDKDKGNFPAAVGGGRNASAKIAAEEAEETAAAAAAAALWNKSSGVAETRLLHRNLSV